MGNRAKTREDADFGLAWTGPKEKTRRKPRKPRRPRGDAALHKTTGNKTYTCAKSPIEARIPWMTKISRTCNRRASRGQKQHPRGARVGRANRCNGTPRPPNNSSYA